jgi:AraC-like DNA-binding protein
MQQHNLNLRLPNKSLGTATDLNQRLIKLEQAPAERHRQPHPADGCARKVDRDSHQTQAEVLAKVIGAHRIRSIDPTTDCRLSYRHHLVTSNFQMLEIEWQGAFQLEQDPLDRRYIIYLVLAGSITQKVYAPLHRLEQIGLPNDGSKTADAVQSVLPIVQLHQAADRTRLLAQHALNTGSLADLLPSNAFNQSAACRRDFSDQNMSDKIGQEWRHQPHQTVGCDPATATIFSPGHKLESIASEQGKVLLMAIDRPSIDAAVSKLLARPLKQPLIFIPSIDLTSELGLSLKKLGRFLWEVAASNATDAVDFSSLVLQKLEQTFLDCAIEGLSNNYSDELLYQTDGALACHVRKARAFIESHLHEDIKLGDIAAAASVCSRLLQKAFSYHCGCSPMRFVTRLRLERIRQELERSTSDTKIMDVMMNYGFTQGGKFAREYQQLFGEKPSDTLKRSSQFQQQQSPLWHEIEDPLSERVVGGRSSMRSSEIADSATGFGSWWRSIDLLRHIQIYLKRIRIF